MSPIHLVKLVRVVMKKWCIVRLNAYKFYFRNVSWMISVCQIQWTDSAMRKDHGMVLTQTTEKIIILCLQVG